MIDRSKRSTSGFINELLSPYMDIGIEEGSISSSAESVLSEDGCSSRMLLGGSLEMQSDMVEQAAMVDRSQHLGVFEHLRTLQALQREQLIKDQQDQWSKLQAGQRAAEARLVAQRQYQWGSKTSPLRMPRSAKESAVQAPVLKTSAGLPQAIAASTLALARIRLQESLQLNGSVTTSSFERSQTQSQHEDDKELDFFSSDNSENYTDMSSSGGASPIPADDDSLGVRLLPDTASETSETEFDVEDTSSNQRVHKKEESGVERQATLTEPPGKLSSWNTSSPIKELSAPFKASNSQAGKKILGEANGDRKTGPSGETAKVTYGSQWKQFSKNSLPLESDSFDVDAAVLGKLYLDETKRTTHIEKHRKVLDEVPVGGGMLQGKTFEQLIDEQLKLEQQKPPSGSQSKKSAHRYLRRGEGGLSVRSSRQPLARARRSNAGKPRTASNKVEQGQLRPPQPKESMKLEPRTLPPKNGDLPTQKHLVASTIAEPPIHDSFSEASYIARVEENEEAEVEELQEFELLERFVDDNASLISNVSISRILPLARDDAVHRLDNNIEGVKSVSSRPMRTAEKTFSPLNDDGVGQHEDADITLVSDDEQPVVDHRSTDRVQQSDALKSIYRKVLSCRVPNSSSVRVVQIPQSDTRLVGKSSEKENLPEGAVWTSESESQSEDSENDDDVSLSSRIMDAVTTNALAVSGNEKVSPMKVSAADGNLSQLNFEDNNEWNDSGFDAKKLTGQSEVNNRLRVEESVTASPPTSKLAARMFPVLKHNAANIKPRSSSAETMIADTGPKASEVFPSQSSIAVREKLAQLEMEIQHFRTENANLTRLRKEQEQVVERLKKEMAEFEKQKTDELKRIEDFKAEENKKLRKQYKVFDKYQQSIKNAPDKKEREELEALKLQLSKLQEEMQKREQRMAANASRLKDRLELVERENAELKQEIRILEQHRLENWKPKKCDTLVNDKPAIVSPEMFPRDGGGDGVVSKPQTSSKLKGAIASRLPVATSQTSLSTLSTSLIPNSSPLALSGIDDDGLGVLAKPVTRKTAPVVSTINGEDHRLNEQPFDELKHPDGKIERICSDGSHEILFANGTRKQISTDGKTIVVSFFNGDIKQILGDGRVVYYYADAKTTHTTYSDGLQIFQFANQQIEKHYIDGTKEIQFPDETIKYLFADGSSESVFPDGTVIRVEKNEDRVMSFPNGQRETHTKQFKRREYPDGTTKTIYADGRQETRYSNGRLRIKDAEGNLIVDQIR